MYPEDTLRDKTYLVHSIQTINCISICMILVIARINYSHMCLLDVKPTTLQFNKPHSGKLFVTISEAEFLLSVDEYFE